MNAPERLLGNVCDCLIKNKGRWSFFLGSFSVIISATKSIIARHGSGSDFQKANSLRMWHATKYDAYTMDSMIEWCFLGGRAAETSSTRLEP